MWPGVLQMYVSVFSHPVARYREPPRSSTVTRSAGQLLDAASAFRAAVLIAPLAQAVRLSPRAIKGDTRHGSGLAHAGDAQPGGVASSACKTASWNAGRNSWRRVLSRPSAVRLVSSAMLTRRARSTQRLVPV